MARFLLKYKVMEKASSRLLLHSRLKTVSRPTAGNIPERVKLMVWSLENFGLLFLHFMKLSHELSIDMIFIIKANCRQISGNSFRRTGAGHYGTVRKSVDIHSHSSHKFKFMPGYQRLDISGTMHNIMLMGDDWGR